jgi:peroxiredoxin
MAQQSGGAVVLFAGLVLAGVYFTRDESLGRPAPALSLRETYGGHVDLQSYRGQPLLLVFWMPSCGICRAELPLIDRMAPEFRGKGVAVVAIDVGDADAGRDYLRSNHIDVTSLEDTEGAAAQAYKVSGVPKLVLIGADGKIKRAQAGMADESGLREWMNAATGS